MNIFNKEKIQIKASIFNYIISLCKVGNAFSGVNILFYFGALSLAGSRLFKIASLFLPIKVLIIQSQDELPMYFDNLIQYITHHEFVILLALFIPITYFSYMALGVIYNNLLDKDKVMQQENYYHELSDKWNENRFQKFHTNVTVSISEIFTILISFLLVLLYSVSFFVLFFVSIVLLYILIFKYILPMKSTDRVTFLKLHRTSLIEYITSICFLIVFLIVFLKMYYSDLDVLGAIYIIMLSRICYQSLSRFSRKGIQLDGVLPVFVKKLV